jgi:hypothetical protein
MTATRVRACAVLFALAVAPGAGAQMPDVRQMSGIPMPSGDVPPGTIVVRVIRGDISNNVSKQAVELTVGGKVLVSTTDESGRATFANIAVGSDAHAVAVVDGERIESSHIELPPASGIRVMLVAGAATGAARAPSAVMPAPAPTLPGVEGDVTFGGQSRIQIEFEDDAMEVFYLLDVVNRAAGPAAPKRELAIDLPAGADTPTILEGSSPLATLRDGRVVLSGPFPPGNTSVQFAFGFAGGPSERVLTQTFPVVWEQVQVMVSRVGTVQLASDQMTVSDGMPGSGQSFAIGNGPALPAGQPLRMVLSGLPHRSRLGRWLALGLGCLVLGVGTWSAYRGRLPSASDARRTQLDTRRQKLLGDLAKLEQQHRSGHGDTARYQVRRGELVARLERVYGELDQSGGPADDR